MIKGAFIFAGGLAVGTVYGLALGFRLTKTVEQVLAEPERPAGHETIRGDVVEPTAQAASA